MYIELIRSVLRRPRKKRSAAPGLMLLATGLAVGTLYAGTPVEAARAAAATGTGSTVAAAPAPSVELASLEARVRAVTAGWDDLERYYDERVAPIERVLRRHGAGVDLARQVAVALVREGTAVQIEPRLLLAVLLLENPWLDPVIRSPVGAVGLMQVMPLHLGSWPDCVPDLEDIDANICHGARIFAHYFRQTGGNIERALLRYNGCVRGTNTPNCHQYPYHVFARAGRASVLAWLDGN